MRSPKFLLAASGLCTLVTAGVAQEKDIFEIAVPRWIAPGVAIQLQVETGPLPRGARLKVETEQGEILGAVTPFGSGPATATIPLPGTIAAGVSVRLRLQVVERGGMARPPAPSEVRTLDLVSVPEVN